MRFYLRALSYYRNDLGKIIASLVLIALSTLLGVVWLLPMGIMLDVVLGQNQPDYAPYRWFLQIAPADKLHQIILLAVLLAVMRVMYSLLDMVRTLITIRVGYNGLMRVRCDLFQKLQELSLAYHRSQPQGDAIYRLTSDTLGFQNVLNTLTGSLVNVFTLIAMAGFMCSMNWKLTLVAMAITPLLMLTIWYYGRIFKKRYAHAYEADSQITTAVQRSVASIGLVQAFGREKDEFENFAATQGNNIKIKMHLHWDEVTYWLALGSIFALGAAALLGIGGYISWQNPTVLTVGMLSMFLFNLEKLYDPLNKLSATGSSLQGGAAAVRRVFEVLDRDPVIQDAPDSVHLPKKPRVLAFDHVGFEYRAGVPVLHDINVTIEPGQMVAFVGSSGVGKTTLLNLLPRFYDPSRGTISFDEIDARKIKVADLRRHVALVLQDSVLLPTTVAENIAYGRPTATDAEIQRAAQMAGAASFIEKLDQRYETQISEYGSNLSGGQKQRISIARALLTEAPIVVLDEPTSALDAEQEYLIIQTLLSLKRQRTMILVSHRLSTVADCDQIFVMEEGKIIERGQHDELVAKRGAYYRMAKHQMKLPEVDPQITQISQIEK
ncbi:MAG TPA: ABC transporter ATP-binding protein [Tepidisphaeraceae bacterium]|nr:ABC transporter ATP-binding protein [Tepidisphaeraceae bacterium]